MIKSSSPLTTTRAVVDALGGYAAVANLTKRKENAVRQWTYKPKKLKRDPTFPPNTVDDFRKALEAKGFRADPSLWRMGQ